MLSRAAGIDPGAIFANFDLASRKSLIAAVSGGSDSLALLLLAESFLRQAAPSVRLAAVTVDHGLRAEAAEEAEHVAAICRSRGIAHRTMRWQASKPAHGIPAAAREARYALLAQAAMEAETDIILTGHTRDDQLETVAMRERRGEGRGLAGMAPATLFDGMTWILRPLLRTPRTALRAGLGEHGVRWIDDPTNLDQSYERPRIRAALSDRDYETVQQAADAAAEERIRLGQMAAKLIERHAVHVAPGLLRLDPAFAMEARDAAVYALRLLLAVTGGVAQLPDIRRTTELFSQIALRNHRATLSRTVIDARRIGIFLHREHRGLPDATLIDAPVAWDGRYRIEPEAGTRVRVEFRGQANAADCLPQDQDAPESLVQAAGWAQPVIQPAADGPSSNQAVIVPILAPWARFLPGFDLAPAAAIAGLVAARPIPRPPFAGHNNPRG